MTLRLPSRLTKISSLSSRVILLKSWGVCEHNLGYVIDSSLWPTSYPVATRAKCLPSTKSNNELVRRALKNMNAIRDVDTQSTKHSYVQVVHYQVPTKKKTRSTIECLIWIASLSVFPLKWCFISVGFAKTPHHYSYSRVWRAKVVPNSLVSKGGMSPSLSNLNKRCVALILG